MEGHVIVVGVGSIHRRSCSVEVSIPTLLLTVLTYVSMNSVSCSDRIVYVYHNHVLHAHLLAKQVLERGGITLSRTNQSKLNYQL